VEVDRLATRSRVVNNDEGVHVDFRPAKELPSMARYMHGAYLVSADRRLEILLKDFC
jgi:hypothetical protein